MSHSIDCVLARSIVPVDDNKDDESDKPSSIGARSESLLLEPRDGEGSLVGDVSGVGCNEGGAEPDLTFP